MNLVRTALALGLCAAWPALVSAQSHIYTCRVNGHMITSDQPIPECSNLPMEERSKSGLVVREISAPLTPAQQAEKEQQDRKAKEAEEEAKDQKRRDMLLMSIYSDDASIESARGRALADYQDSLRAARDRLTSLVSDRAALKKETDPYGNKPLPPALQRRVDALDAEISGASRTIDDRKADIARVNARFDADLARFKELEAKAAANNAQPRR